MYNNTMCTVWVTKMHAYKNWSVVTTIYIHVYIGRLAPLANQKGEASMYMYHVITLSIHVHEHFHIVYTYFTYVTQYDLLTEAAVQEHILSLLQATQIG